MRGEWNGAVYVEGSKKGVRWEINKHCGHI